MLVLSPETSLSRLALVSNGSSFWITATVLASYFTYEILVIVHLVISLSSFNKTHKESSSFAGRCKEARQKCKESLHSIILDAMSEYKKHNSYWKVVGTSLVSHTIKLLVWVPCVLVFALSNRVKLSGFGFMPILLVTLFECVWAHIKSQMRHYTNCMQYQIRKEWEQKKEFLDDFSMGKKTRQAWCLHQFYWCKTCILYTNYVVWCKHWVQVSIFSSDVVFSRVGLQERSCWLFIRSAVSPVQD